MSCRRSSKKAGDGNVVRSELLFCKRFLREAGKSDGGSESCKLSTYKRFSGEAAVAWGANWEGHEAFFIFSIGELGSGGWT